MGLVDVVVGEPGELPVVAGALLVAAAAGGAEDLVHEALEVERPLPPLGIVGGEPALDLNYDEDVSADVDMNVVMSSEGRFVEVQGTAERATFDRGALDALLDLATEGTRRLDAAQREALAR